MDGHSLRFPNPVRESMDGGAVEVRSNPVRIQFRRKAVPAYESRRRKPTGKRTEERTRRRRTTTTEERRRRERQGNDVPYEPTAEESDHVSGGRTNRRNKVEPRTRGGTNHATETAKAERKNENGRKRTGKGTTETNMPAGDEMHERRRRTGEKQGRAKRTRRKTTERDDADFLLEGDLIRHSMDRGNGERTASRRASGRTPNPLKVFFFHSPFIVAFCVAGRKGRKRDAEVRILAFPLPHPPLVAFYHYFPFLLLAGGSERDAEVRILVRLFPRKGAY